MEQVPVTQGGQGDREGLYKHCRKLTREPLILPQGVGRGEVNMEEMGN